LRLKPLGKIRGLDGEENILLIATSLMVFDDAGILWMGGYEYRYE
jgi:hypothetical protein